MYQEIQYLSQELHARKNATPQGIRLNKDIEAYNEGAPKSGAPKIPMNHATNNNAAHNNK